MALKGNVAGVQWGLLGFYGGGQQGEADWKDEGYVRGEGLLGGTD